MIIFNIFSNLQYDKNNDLFSEKARATRDRYFRDRLLENILPKASVQDAPCQDGRTSFVLSKKFAFRSISGAIGRRQAFRCSATVVASATPLWRAKRIGLSLSTV